MFGLDRATAVSVFAGGAVGALARVGALQAFGDATPRWPWTILATNLLAAFVLGVIAEQLTTPGRWGRYRAALIGSGFAGALSTFSTLAGEIERMLAAGAVGIAVAYAAVSIAGGLAAIVLARRVVRAVAVRGTT